MCYFRILVLTLLLAATGVAQQSMNMTAFKQEARIFERVVSEVLRQDFTHPFALETEPLTTYVSGYGVVVTFHLKINRPTFQGVSSGTQAGEAEKRGTEEQIRLVEQRMMECLADFGRSLRQLNSNEHITISAHIEDRGTLNPRAQRTVLTLSALKDDIDYLSANRISPEEFRGKVRVLRY
ncbi:MAG TPA: hypothetical protein VLU25_07055 [Acidobacteriota bacterium]|nr:hypothetical protein [Acidobacteriota bacterium]